MSASGGVVLTLGAVVSSPVAWLLYDGQISLDDALLRIGICMAVVWAAVSVVSAVAFSPAPVRLPAEQSPTATPPVEPAPENPAV